VPRIEKRSLSLQSFKFQVSKWGKQHCWLIAINGYSWGW